MRILQIALLRPSEFGRIRIEGEEHDLPPEVLSHFRDLLAIGTLSPQIQISVFDSIFADRAAYFEAATSFIDGFEKERCIVFVDPDTGLQPGRKPNLTHVLEAEVRLVWQKLKPGDVLALYQHRTNRNGKPWAKEKQKQLANAIGNSAVILLADSPEIASDVVLFFIQKPA